MSSMHDCPLPELIAQFRDSAKKKFDEGDMMFGMVFNTIAGRLETCETLLTRWLDDEEMTDDLTEQTEKQLGRN